MSVSECTVGHRQGRTAPYQRCRLQRLHLQPLTLGESFWENDFRKHLVAPLEKLKLKVTAACLRKLRGTAVQTVRRRTMTSFVDRELEGRLSSSSAIQWPDHGRSRCTGRWAAGLESAVMQG